MGRQAHVQAYKHITTIALLHPVSRLDTSARGKREEMEAITLFRDVIEFSEDSFIIYLDVV